MYATPTPTPQHYVIPTPQCYPTPSPQTYVAPSPALEKKRSTFGTIFQALACIFHLLFSYTWATTSQAVYIMSSVMPNLGEIGESIETESKLFSYLGFSMAGAELALAILCIVTCSTLNRGVNKATGTLAILIPLAFFTYLTYLTGSLYLMVIGLLWVGFIAFINVPLLLSPEGRFMYFLRPYSLKAQAPLQMGFYYPPTVPMYATGQ